MLNPVELDGAPSLPFRSIGIAKRGNPYAASGTNGARCLRRRGSSTAASDLRGRNAYEGHSQHCENNRDTSIHSSSSSLQVAPDQWSASHRRRLSSNPLTTFVVR